MEPSAHEKLFESIFAELIGMIWYHIGLDFWVPTSKVICFIAGFLVPVMICIYHAITICCFKKKTKPEDQPKLINQ